MKKLRITTFVTVILAIASAAYRAEVSAQSTTPPRGYYPSVLYAYNASGAIKALSVDSSGNLMNALGAGFSPAVQTPPRGYYPMVLYAINASGSVIPLSVDGNGSLIVTSTGGSGGATPSQTTGAGAGTGPTGVGLSGSAFAFNVQITTGTTPTANATITTVTFPAGSFTANPRIVCGARNAATADATYFATAVAATAVLSSGNTALAASTPYAWDCIVKQP